MKTAINKNQLLEELLIQAELDKTKLIPLLAKYSDLASVNEPGIVDQYKERIQSAFLPWEKDDVEVTGMRYLADAISHFYSAHFHNVLVPCKKALEILEFTPNKQLFGVANLIHGTSSRSLGDLDVAVKHLLIGSEMIAYQSEFEIYKGYCFYQLAEIYVYIKDYKEAEKNYLLAAEIIRKLKNNTGEFRVYNGLATNFLAQGNYDECKYYLDLSLTINGLTDTVRSRSFCDLGIYYHAVKDYINAEKNLLISYEYRITADMKDAASTCLISLSKTLMELGRFDEALNKLQQGLSIAIDFQSKAKMIEAYHAMATIYARMSEWQKSSEAYAMYDHLQTEQTTKQLQNIYHLKNQQIQKQKVMIEKIYEEVQDSIRYAKRIQTAILPSDKLADELLKDHFILYKPKDIVAGDFYWMEQKNDTILFAAADCTGHGVPGAMVSVVCNNALNRSVREYNLCEPGMILDKTRDIVVQEFEKSNNSKYPSDETISDGMDIALVSLKKEKDGTTLLKFSGANNPLWIIRKNATEIEELKAQKQPIGKFEASKSFQTQTCKLLQGESIYIFSDGFVDQFGGNNGKKFKASALKELLLSIQNETMQQQKIVLDKAFENWRGNLEQIDDVCIIGVRI